MPHIDTATFGQNGRTTWIERIAHRLASLFGSGEEPEQGLPRPGDDAVSGLPEDVPSAPVLKLVAPEPVLADEPETFRWRRHPQLRAQPASSLAMDEREARHEAVRGLFAARAGAFSCAEQYFTEAARCEAIDLTAIPGFWQLERRAMTAAVNAYEAAGRIRDASALAARIRSMYRPRALSPLPENVTHMPATPDKASRSI